MHAVKFSVARNVLLGCKMSPAPAPADFEDLLRIYYRRLFPYDPYVRWVGAGGDSPSQADRRAYLGKREFSFTLRDDIYLRYLSFSSAEELKQEMVRRLPHKIDLGAVYNARPSDHLKVLARTGFMRKSYRQLFGVKIDPFRAGAGLSADGEGAGV